MAMNEDQATTDVIAALQTAQNYLAENNIGAEDPQYLRKILEAIIYTMFAHIRDNARISIDVPQTQNSGIEVSYTSGGEEGDGSVSVTNQGVNPQINIINGRIA